MLLSLLMASMSVPQAEGAASLAPPVQEPSSASQSSAPLPPFQASALLTAGSLKQRCEAMEAANASYCFAYIVGVYDTVRAYESWLKMREFCVPGGVVQSDLRRAFVTYLNENPGYHAGEAASVVVVALKVKYPCDDPAKPAGPLKPTD